MIWLKKLSIAAMVVIIFGRDVYALFAPVPPPKLTIEDIIVPSANELVQAILELLMPSLQ